MSDQSISADLANIADIVTTANATERTMQAHRKAKASSPHGKFAALATVRTKKALKAIRLLTSMGRSKAYEYSSDDAAKIITALEGEIAVLKRSMNEPGQQTDIEFDL